MKKNKMMRLASSLLVAVLLTSSVISGTFAKYVTADEATDKARVAKWGVNVVVEGSELFSDIYESGNETVKTSVIDENVVAPGTKNDKGVKFTLTGAPEVDVNVEITVDVVKEVFLASGNEYADMTTGNATDKFSFTGDNYYPVVFTLTNGAGNELATGRLTAIKTYLENLSGTYDANTNLGSTDLGANVDGTYKLTWAWDFPTTANAETDKKDTLLGNLSADKTTRAKWVDTKFYALSEGTDFCTDVQFEVSITVTQID